MKGAIQIKFIIIIIIIIINMDGNVPTWSMQMYLYYANPYIRMME